MITKRDVQHVAKLARLGLTEREAKKFQKELSKILDFIERLKEVDILKVEPTSHSIKVENIMREDRVKIEGLEVRKKLVEMAPEEKGGYVRVKAIL